MEEDRNLYLIKDYDEHLDILYRILDNFIYVSSNYSNEDDFEKVTNGIEELIERIVEEKKETIAHLTKRINSLKEKELKIKESMIKEKINISLFQDISKDNKKKLESSLEITRESIEFFEKELKCLKKIKKAKKD